MADPTNNVFLNVRERNFLLELLDAYVLLPGRDRREKHVEKLRDKLDAIQWGDR